MCALWCGAAVISAGHGVIGAEEAQEGGGCSGGADCISTFKPAAGRQEGVVASAGTKLEARFMIDRCTLKRAQVQHCGCFESEKHAFVPETRVLVR